MENRYNKKTATKWNNIILFDNNLNEELKSYVVMKYEVWSMKYKEKYEE